MVSHSENLVEMQKRFFVVSIYVDGRLVANKTVSAYTEDMAIIRALVPEVLSRLGLVEPFEDVLTQVHPVDEEVLQHEASTSTDDLT